MGRRFVLDASALLCLLAAEKGADAVLSALPDSVIGAVNLSEAIAKLAERGVSASAIDAALGGLDLTVVPFDREQARAAGLLRAKTRKIGLSPGDRACLALASVRGETAMTCDAAWATLALGCDVALAR